MIGSTLFIHNSTSKDYYFKWARLIQINQMKKILNLEQAALLKKNLEKGSFYSIDKNNQLIEENNSIIAGKERQVNIQELEDEKEMKSELLIILYLAIQLANLKKSKNKGENYCNAYYIKKLSELEREKSHLIRLNTANNSFINYKTVLSRTKSIEKDIQEIKGKIKKFNEGTNISIEITKEMSDFLKSIEN